MGQSTPIRRKKTLGGDAHMRSKAVVALHLVALRRQFDAIRMIFGETPPHRSREALWVALEVLQAELDGERIALRDLVARADGLLSAPTLSRVVSELEQEGLLASATEGRLKLLRPTARALDILAARRDEAYLALTSTVSRAKRHPAVRTPDIQAETAPLLDVVSGLPQ